MTESFPTPIDIPDEDDLLLAQCRVDTFRAGGKGGQHQNKTESAVRLTHLPSGIRAASRNERSQHRNKVLALQRLRRKLEKRNRRDAPRIQTKVPVREKRKRLEDKKKRGRTKDLRKRLPDDTDG